MAAPGGSGNGNDKRAQLLKAAEHLERGIEAYAAGDLEGAVGELQAALELQPSHARAQQYLAWLEQLQAGKVRPYGDRDAVDEDTLQAVSDALSNDDLFADAPSTNVPASDDDQTRVKQAGAESESPWDPVPLTPGPTQAPREISLQALEAMAPPTRSPSSSSLKREKRETPLVGSGPQQNQPTWSPPIDGRRRSSNTLLGVAPIDRPSLTPPPSSPGALYDENTRSMTREWRSTPTGTNLPPLDVPELTDEQIQELLALDGAPALDVGKPPHLPTMELPLGPDMLGSIPPAVPVSALELEAEPTPNPHPNPLAGNRSSATTPDAQLGPAFGGNEFEQGYYDLTPTLERRDLLKQLAGPPAQGGDEDLALPPLDMRAGVEPQVEGSIEDAGSKTNPFIQQRLAEYATFSPPPKEDDLPLPPPGPSDTSPTAAIDGVPAIQDPLDRGDIDAALQAAEQFVATHGGLSAPACHEQRWLLERVYESQVGSLGAVPRHGTPSPDLDPRQAFLLSRIDGMSSAEDLLEISGMPRLEALRCLALLIRRGAVAMH